MIRDTGLFNHDFVLTPALYAQGWRKYDMTEHKGECPFTPLVPEWQFPWQVMFADGWGPGAPIMISAISADDPRYTMRWSAVVAYRTFVPELLGDHSLVSDEAAIGAHAKAIKDLASFGTEVTVVLSKYNFPSSADFCFTTGPVKRAMDALEKIVPEHCLDIEP